MGIRNWMKNDICWCMETDCPYVNCFRNPKNRDPEIPYYSGAYMKGRPGCLYQNKIREETGIVSVSQEKQAL